MVNFGGVSGEQLRQLVARIEKLEEEKKEIMEYIKDTYGEAKSQGFDTKILKKVVALRKREYSELAEEEAIMDIYKHALGMIPSESDIDAAAAETAALNDKNESEEAA